MKSTDAFPSTNRRGAILVVTMICLLLVTSLMGALLKMALSQRRQIRQEQFRIQADWLTESGANRAIYQMNRQENYKGEEWKIPADQLDGHSPATVTIAVKPPEKENDPKQITVVVRYPADSATAVHQEKTFTH